MRNSTKSFLTSDWRAIRPITGTDDDDFLDFSDSLIPLRLNAGDGNDTVYGGSGNDWIIAGDGDDMARGGGGDDILLGGRGNDIAVYDGSILDFLWRAGCGNSLIVTDTSGQEGRDLLKQFEVLQFADYTLVLGGANAALATASDLTTDEDSAASGQFSALDFDGGSVSVVSLSVTGGGQISLRPGQTSLSAGMGQGAVFTYDFSPDGAYEFLGVGEQATETATVVISDGQGNLTTETFVVTITGVNDAPEILSVTADGDTVFEDGDLDVAGQVIATDPDSNDILFYAVQGGGAGQYGTMTIDGDGNWHYELANGSALVQALDASDRVTDEFVFEVSDGHGGIVTVNHSVTIQGADEPRPGTLLTFDDLSNPATFGGVMPSNYGGLTWSADARFMETDEYNQFPGVMTGYHNGVVSGDNVAFNAFANPVTVSSAADFDLESVWLGAAWRDGMTVRADAWNDGILLGFQEFVVNTAGAILAEFDDDLFDAVDQVTFSTFGGTDAGLGLSTAQFVMDDLLYFA